MFQQASVRTTLRDDAVITATETLTISDATQGFADSNALFVCFNVTGRTQGSITVTFQGSLDGATWFQLPAALGVTLNADGLTSVDLNSQDVPKYVRATLTYASSFDGSLEVWAQSNLTAG